VLACLAILAIVLCAASIIYALSVKVYLVYQQMEQLAMIVTFLIAMGVPVRIFVAAVLLDTPLTIAELVVQAVIPAMSLTV
jgi:hypothetical protein